MATVAIVPGLAVRSYAEGPARALRARGHEVRLGPAPAWKGQPSDLNLYGQRLAQQFDQDGRPVDLLIGLSVGTQAAGVAAARSSWVRRLLLVSPTVDPARRTRRALIKAWLVEGDQHRDSPSVLDQLPDWAHAGPLRIYRGLVSATRVDLDVILREVSVPITLVHADADRLSALEFAAQLAERDGTQLVVMPDAPHSWPLADEARFCEFVEQLLDEPATTETELTIETEGT